MEYKTVEAGGKSYRLCYTTNALCQLEDKADGMALANMAARRINGFIRYMFWAALIAYQPETTLEEAGDVATEYIQKNGGREAAFKLIKELQVLAGIVGDDEKNGEKPQKA